MNPDRADLFLDLMRESASNASAFVKGMSRETFLADLKCRYAVSMCLIVIGENAAKLAKYHPEFVAAHPETPWSKAINMRHRIAHWYAEVDFDVVWSTVTEDMPEFLRSLPQSRPLDEN